MHCVRLCPAILMNKVAPLSVPRIRWAMDATRQTMIFRPHIADIVFRFNSALPEPVPVLTYEFVMSLEIDQALLLTDSPDLVIESMDIFKGRHPIRRISDPKEPIPRIELLQH